MAQPVVDILMFHSISEQAGPTSISPDIFAAQMGAIADAGVPVITMDEFLEAKSGRADLAPYSIVISFDDGFRDFLQSAWPVLAKHKFLPVVYLPTGNMGGTEDWDRGQGRERQLLSWHEVMGLHSDGVLFGSHTVSHANLNKISSAVVDAELTQSQRELQDRLGTNVAHFAPPYGKASKSVRRQIAQHYLSSVGTRLGSSTLQDDLLNLPRIEMCYFTDPARWQSHLAGRGGAYLRARKTLRSVRQVVVSSWQT